ncbi:complexin-like [Parasteatoda tepidariorum]|uniref:complexin-like n=1 Tax=Parasteatoda tepidariorum TaxID=114398 RepID=UPI001C71C222|nr:complexin-like [Parasteatoda tepidariorum]XP_042896999.1 complexin-like [Parasteatoda tepidariorum]XP_042897000.1 complexin-like [Parasteatoda tepidariorum]
MAAFVAKQMMGSKLNAVKGQMSSAAENETPEDKEAAAELEQERLEALREAEERRKEKHKRMEEEREKMRQAIRDKYGIKKKEEVEEEDYMPESNSLNRKKKTPAEIEAEDLDDFTRWKNTIEAQLGELRQTLESKCVIQ